MAPLERMDAPEAWEFRTGSVDVVVAGTVAASGNNALGIAGLNWISQVMILRIMDAFGDSDTAKAVRAIAYANQMGADVITLSWEDSAFSQGLKDASAELG